MTQKNKPHYWLNALDDGEKIDPVSRSVLFIERPVSCGLCRFNYYDPDTKELFCLLALHDVALRGPDNISRKPDILSLKLSNDPLKSFEVFRSFRQQKCPLVDLPDYDPEDRSQALGVLAKGLIESEEDGWIHTEKDLKSAILEKEKREEKLAKDKEFIKTLS